MRIPNPQTIIVPVPVQSNNEGNYLKEIEELKQEIQKLKEQQKKKKKRAEVEDQQSEYSEYKSDGKPKASAADSIRSYDDFKAIQDYFLKRGKIRDWALWTVGVCLGLRISDLVSLKIKNVLNQDRTFKPRMQVLEKKTSKLNNILITEAVVYALTKYFDSINWDFTLHDYIFKSQKGGKMTEQHGWRILSEAGKALKLPINIGSHTMRKSFGNIVMCVSKSTIDMNAITKLQVHYNHADQRVTMKYIGALKNACDEDRVAVSDFVLGRTHINELKIS